MILRDKEGVRQNKQGKNRADQPCFFSFWQVIYKIGFSNKNFHIIIDKTE